MNKLDLVKEKNIDLPLEDSPNTMWVSSITKENIYELKELIAKQAPSDESKFQIVGDLLDPSDFVVLVVPIDKSRSKGKIDTSSTTNNKRYIRIRCNCNCCKRI